MYSIYDSLLNYSYSMKSEYKTKVFLHTSCVLDSRLAELFVSKRIRNRFDFFLMNDTYCEVRMLRKSHIGNIGRNAALILKSCSRYIDGNLRYHYHLHNSRPYITERLLPSPDNEYIFVFYNPSAAEEFILNTTPSEEKRTGALLNNIDLSALDSIRILAFNQKLDGSVDFRYSYTAPVRLSTFRYENLSEWKLRPEPRIVNVSPAGSTEGYKKLCIKGLFGDKKAVISKSRLTHHDRGGLADIYTVNNCTELKGKAIKIFKDKCKSDIMKEYLMSLKIYNDIFGDRIAFPEGVVTDEQGDIIGFVMKFFDNINTVRGLDVIRGTQSILKYEDSQKRAADLSLLLLEMSLFQLTMTDISHSNICFDKSGRTVIVDADSIETRNYIFNQYLVNPKFAHRNLIMHRKSVRAYHFPDVYVNFSYAVLLYQLYFINSPLEHNKSDYPEWDTAKKYGISSVTEEKICSPSPLNKLWSEMTPDFRKSFVSHFSGNTIYTIGQWLDILKLE